MEQSPSWEATQFSASQQIPRILWNQNVRYPIHKWTPSVPNLSQLDSVDPLHPTSWRSILIVFSHLHLGLPTSLFLLGVHNKTLLTPLLSPNTRYMPRPSHNSRFYHPQNIGWTVQNIQLLIMQFPPLLCNPVSSKASNLGSQRKADKLITLPPPLINMQMRFDWSN